MKTRKFKLTLAEYYREIERATTAEAKQALLSGAQVTDSEVILTRTTDR